MFMIRPYKMGPTKYYTRRWRLRRGTVDQSHQRQFFSLLPFPSSFYRQNTGHMFRARHLGCPPRQWHFIFYLPPLPLRLLPTGVMPMYLQWRGPAKDDERRPVGGSASARPPGPPECPETRDQSRKSRYLVEDGVWRGLQVFQLHRRLQDCPFWESWLHTPDFHAHALVQVSGHSPDLDFLCLVKCLSPVQSSLALCWAGPQAGERGFPSGREAVTEVEPGHLLLLTAACSWSTEKYLEPWKSRSVSSMDYEIWSTKQQSDQYPVLCFAVGGRCSLGAGALARY
ncbi:hypothetical protein CFAM422_005915 [Trichoderma lentiforme]|uniref:Uncharacterized protein n=1 Tax=Trichoderma lentiforme TaxID=1567552 RepID=A0A9P4XE93_9HYPO|nr:hypothetical protein CFAM422_005915 [Trichoderma lentiforme]